MVPALFDFGALCEAHGFDVEDDRPETGERAFETFANTPEGTARSSSGRLYRRSGAPRPRRSCGAVGVAHDQRHDRHRRTGRPPSAQRGGSAQDAAWRSDPIHDLGHARRPILGAASERVRRGRSDRRVLAGSQHFRAERRQTAAAPNRRAPCRRRARPRRPGSRSSRGNAARRLCRSTRESCLRSRVALVVVRSAARR